MYHPGGARLGLAGIVSPRFPAARLVISRSTSRCSLSKEWVVVPLRIRDAHLMAGACGVVIVIVSPYEPWTGAEVIWGWGPRNRYGGLNSSSCSSSCGSGGSQATWEPPSGLPPAATWRPAASSTAVEWYKRGTAAAAVRLQLFVAGS